MIAHGLYVILADAAMEPPNFASRVSRNTEEVQGYGEPE